VQLTSSQNEGVRYALVDLMRSTFVTFKFFLSTLCLDYIYESTLIVMQFFMYAIRQEAAGALWNLSFNDRNREAIAATGGVEALVNPSFPLPFLHTSGLLVTIIVLWHI
jgi:hypothetical protein